MKEASRCKQGSKIERPGATLSQSAKEKGRLRSRPLKTIRKSETRRATGLRHARTKSFAQITWRKLLGGGLGVNRLKRLESLLGQFRIEFADLGRLGDKTLIGGLGEIGLNLDGS